MKRFLSIVLLSCVVGVSVNAHMLMRMEDMKEMMHSLEGKTFTIPGNLVEEWLALKAKTLEFGADSMRECASQFKDASTRAKWEAVADQKEALAESLLALPVPAELTKKLTHEHIATMLELKEMKLALKAKKMRVIARQLDDKDARAMLNRKADRLDKISKKLAEVSQKAGCQAEPEEEASEIEA